LLVAAEEAGQLLVCGCRHGACGMCRARLVSGRVVLRPHLDQALSQADEAAGGTLPCCAVPDGDIVVQLPYDSSRVVSAH